MIQTKLDKGAEMPTRAHDTDVGYDIKALHTWLIEPDGTEHKIWDIRTYDACAVCGVTLSKIKIDTGVHVKPPHGYYVELVPNSRIAKTSFMHANSIGIIDPEYTGSIKVVLNIVGSIKRDDVAKFLPGNVVGQLIIRKKYDAYFIEVDNLGETQRGDGGFGSTENK